MPNYEDFFRSAVKGAGAVLKQVRSSAPARAAGGAVKGANLLGEMASGNIKNMSPAVRMSVGRGTVHGPLTNSSEYSSSVWRGGNLRDDADGLMTAGLRNRSEIDRVIKAQHSNADALPIGTPSMAQRHGLSHTGAKTGYQGSTSPGQWSRMGGEQVVAGPMPYVPQKGTNARPAPLYSNWARASGRKSPDPSKNFTIPHGPEPLPEINNMLRFADANVENKLRKVREPIPMLSRTPLPPLQQLTAPTGSMPFKPPVEPLPEIAAMIDSAPIAKQLRQEIKAPANAAGGIGANSAVNFNSAAMWGAGIGAAWGGLVNTDDGPSLSGAMWGAVGGAGLAVGLAHGLPHGLTAGGKSIAANKPFTGNYSGWNQSVSDTMISSAGWLNTAGGRAAMIGSGGLLGGQFIGGYRNKRRGFNKNRGTRI